MYLPQTMLPGFDDVNVYPEKRSHSDRLKVLGDLSAMSEESDRT
ncbi:hypothetical protein [Coleofasciculus sp.]